MPQTPLLPYPAQLPQDYYSKNLPSLAAPVAPSIPGAPVVTPPTPPSGSAITSGGIYYGDIPPANPQYGWHWTSSSGNLYVYMAPGIWSQVGTNW